MGLWKLQSWNSKLSHCLCLRVSLGQTFLAFYYSFYGGVEPAENTNHGSVNVSFSNSFRKYQFGICNKESSISEINGISQSRRMGNSGWMLHCKRSSLSWYFHYFKGKDARSQRGFQISFWNSIFILVIHLLRDESLGMDDGYNLGFS